MAIDENDEPVIVNDGGQPIQPETDWDALEAMTDDEVRAAASEDPDAAPLTEEQRSRLRHIDTPRAIRRRLGFTQEQFASRFGIALGTLRDWEQGRRPLDQTAQTLMLAIDADPKLIASVVASRHQIPAD